MARSTNKYDIHNWILRVIELCQTHMHDNGARRLIRIFLDKYDDYDLHRIQRNKLEQQLDKYIAIARQRNQNEEQRNLYPGDETEAL